MLFVSYAAVSMNLHVARHDNRFIVQEREYDKYGKLVREH